MLALVRQNPSFRRLFQAHAVSRSGDAFNTVALVVLVFQLTGTGRGVAATVAFEVAPVLLLGPVAGLVVDRFPRSRVMVAADLGRAALALALAAFGGPLPLVFAAAFGLSVGSMLFNPAASSLLPEVVDEEQLVEANSAMWMVAVVAQVALAPAAGLLIATAGARAAFAVNAVSFVVSAILLRGLRQAEAPADGVVVPGWRGALEGTRLVLGDAFLRRLAFVQVLASLSAGATGGLLVVLAAERLGVGPGGFGLLLAAIGVGAAGGPLLLRRWIRASDRRWLFIPYAVRGGVDLSLAVVQHPALAGGALVTYGMATSSGMIAYQSTLQKQVPALLRGRVYAFFDVVWNGARLVSLGVGGLLADAVGIRAVYVVGGLLLLAGAAVGLVGGRGGSPAVASPVPRPT